MLVLFIVLLFQLELALGDGEAGYKALKFGEDRNSYIRFSPDMSPFQNQFSVCSWIKKLHTRSSFQTWFHYYDQQIWMTDSGSLNRIFRRTNIDSALTSKFTVPQGQWFHQCNTWSLRSRTLRVYLNGQLVGSDTTPSGRTLTLGQALYIGNYRPDHSYYFGGELYQLNVYSEELSSSDVQALAGGGPCSGGEELHDDTRLLKWEEILRQTRTGTVKEIEIDSDTWACKLVKDLKEQFKSQLNHTETRFNATLSELAQTKKEMEQQLNSTTRELEKATKQLDNITECFQEKAAITQWDSLYSDAFFNKIFTRDLYTKLRSSWNFLEDFVGVRMTDGLINLFKDYHSKETCACDPPGGET